jgi:amino acid transporter
MIYNVGDPLAFVFEKLDLNGCRDYCSKCSSSNGECFIGLSNGTTRIWMSMSRDGLLPKRFSKCTSNTKHLLTQLSTGFVVAVPALFC